jgi:hypothetical protein
MAVSALNVEARSSLSAHLIKSFRVSGGLPPQPNKIRLQLAVSYVCPHVNVTCSQVLHAVDMQLKPLTLRQINLPEAHFVATDEFGRQKTCSVTALPGTRNYS